MVFDFELIDRASIRLATFTYGRKLAKPNGRFLRRPDVGELRNIKLEHGGPPLMVAPSLHLKTRCMARRNPHLRSRDQEANLNVRTS